jgi:anti-sigma-K factor RskA
LAVQAADAIGSFDAIGVSIEPDGGSPQPTGDIVMLSNLSSS